MSYNVLDKITYTLVLDSLDKISGTNNNATFNVNWATFLPMKYSYYKVIFNFQTVGGYYKDNVSIFSSAKVCTDLQGNSFSYDTLTNGGSNMLGLIQRNDQVNTSAGYTLSCYPNQNVSKTIVRPSTNRITISIYNNYSGDLLVTTTDNTGATLSVDMTSWTAMLEFIPIADSKTM
jgi:hypothetical protein